MGIRAVIAELHELKQQDALFSSRPRLASAKCLEDTEVFVIRRSGPDSQLRAKSCPAASTRHDFDNVLKEERASFGNNISASSTPSYFVQNCGQHGTVAVEHPVISRQSTCVENREIRAARRWSRRVMRS